MRSTPLLTEAQPLEGYTVHIRFEDGTIGSPTIIRRGGGFRPFSALRDARRSDGIRMGLGRDLRLLPKPAFRPGLLSGRSSSYRS
jgi:hypothetical protein